MSNTQTKKNAFFVLISGFKIIKGGFGCTGNPDLNGSRVINNSICSKPFPGQKIGNPQETLRKPSETPAETLPEALGNPSETLR